MCERKMWLVLATTLGLVRWPAVPAASPRSWSGKQFESDAQLMHPHSDLAHRLWAACLQPGDAVVDATAGNGHDTLALVHALADVGGGLCHACDIQTRAIASAQARMRESLRTEGWQLDEPVRGEGMAEGGSAAWLATSLTGAAVEVRWHVGCHAELLSTSLTPGSTRLVVFNLGYLPGGDKSVVTTAESTVAALRAAELVVQPGGFVSATLYPGHEAGGHEAQVALEYAAALPMQQWSVYHHVWLNNRNKKTGVPAPSLLHIQKIY
jgi:hypothetical protein